MGIWKSITDGYIINGYEPEDSRLQGKEGPALGLQMSPLRSRVAPKSGRGTPELPQVQEPLLAPAETAALVSSI